MSEGSILSTLNNAYENKHGNVKRYISPVVRNEIIHHTNNTDTLENLMRSDFNGNPISARKTQTRNGLTKREQDRVSLNTLRREQQQVEHGDPHAPNPENTIAKKVNFRLGRDSQVISDTLLPNLKPLSDTEVNTPVDYRIPTDPHHADVNALDIYQSPFVHECARQTKRKEQQKAYKTRREEEQKKLDEMYKHINNLK